jgi:hypothetical protein
MSSASEGARLARQAYDLTADLMTPKPVIYWADMLATVLVTYSAFALAVSAHETWAVIGWSLVCLLALYRGVSFIHEITHLRPGEAPGFRFGWNLLVGVPALTPSFMYEGVHNLHHAKTRYGTKHDPEYLPLSHYAPLRVLTFIAISLLAPLGVALRFGVIAPLTFVFPGVRVWAARRASALTINPAFVRADVEQSKSLAWRVAGVRLLGLVLDAGCRGDRRMDPVADPGIGGLDLCRHGADQPASHRLSARLAQRKRAHDLRGAVPRFGECAAASPAAGALGSRRPALPRPASPAAQVALSQPGKGPCPARRGPCRRPIVRSSTRG